MADRLRLLDGLSVGLLGGSFNPAHDGHRQISLEALHRLGLDYVVWLVTPGNPQKKAADYAPLDTRLATARACASHPRIVVDDFEVRAGTRYTAQTLAALTARYRDMRPVWLMGADNLASFHTWRDWRRSAASVPIAVFNRPGYALAPLSAPAARALARERVPASEARTLPLRPAPAWTFFPATNNPQSSTALREAR